MNKLSLWFGNLAEREQKLVLAFVGILAVLIFVMVPVALQLSLSAEQEQVEKLEQTLQAIDDAKGPITKRKEELAALERRYAKPAPELAGYLAGVANESQMSIPESQDKSTVPSGKTFKERTTKLRLSKLGMLKLATFLEKLSISGYPVSVTRLDLKKRGGADEYDLDLEVSAYDREASKPKAPKAPKASSEQEAP